MRLQMRWENEKQMRWQNEKVKKTGIYTHEQLVAKHQCFTPRTTKRS